MKIKNFSKSIPINTTNDKYGTVYFDFEHSEICLQRKVPLISFLKMFCSGKNFKKYSHECFHCSSILTIAFMIVHHLVEQCFKTSHAKTSAVTCMF